MKNFNKYIIVFLIFIVKKTEAENNVCELYSQCETRARYEEQLCIGHEWRKPSFLKPTYISVMTNTSKCYLTLKPEFDAIEQLETDMYERFTSCLVKDLDNKKERLDCKNKNFRSRNFLTSVDPPTSCFIGKIRIDRECGDLKECCPNVYKCSEERRNSDIVYKILDLHKQLKKQLSLCKNKSKNKRRHPNKSRNIYNENSSISNDNRRLNIRVGNNLSGYHSSESLTNLENAPKDNSNNDKVSFDSVHIKTQKKSSVIKKSDSSASSHSMENEEVIINNVNKNNNINIDSENHFQKVGYGEKNELIENNEKNSFTSLVDVKIHDDNDNNNNEMKDKTIIILCNKTEPISDNVEKINEKKNKIVKGLDQTKIDLLSEQLKNTLKSFKNKSHMNANEVGFIEINKHNNYNELSKYSEEERNNNFDLNTTNVEENISSNKGEVSNPFLLILNKFKKIQFPKLLSSTEYPPHLEMITKDTHLTFENVTLKTTSYKDNNFVKKMDTSDNEHIDNIKIEQNGSLIESHKKVHNNEIAKSSIKIDNLNVNLPCENESKNSTDSKNDINSDHALLNTLLQGTKYEDKEEKLESSKLFEHNNLNKNIRNKNVLEIEENKSNLQDIDGLDIMKKEYQAHLEKILALKRKEELEREFKEKQISFYKLNASKKSSHESHHEELIEMSESKFDNNNEQHLSSSIINDTTLKNIVDIVKRCKSRYAGAVKILDDNTKPINLRNSFINWKKTLNERLIKVKEDKTISVDALNEFVKRIENDTNDIEKLIDINNNNEHQDDDTIFGDIICEPISDNNQFNILNRHVEEDIVHSINNSDYKKEIEKFKKLHSITYDIRFPNETKFLTSCDHYLKCRSHVNLILDTCASLISERPAIPSTESILLSGINMCGDLNIPYLSELYSLYIRRNMKLRKCLQKHDDIGGSTDICNSNANELMAVTKKIMKEQESQLELGKCFSDVNKLQNKCYQMSKCCPEYDDCKKDIIDIKIERRIIYLTAKITESNQNCLEKYERKFLKFN
uniref:SH3 domain-containing protein n=1 Tax=Parastrongyloides trichosuri TaxID=131310 RepID=A0A0N4ZB76_PARTI